MQELFLLPKKKKLFFVNIPFKLDFTHAQVKRSFSDSLILMLEDNKGNRGFGEAIVRDYVSGKLVDSDNGTSLIEIAGGAVNDILSPLVDRGRVSLYEISDYFENLKVEKQLLPFVCASELALLDYLCRQYDRDIYEFIGKNPIRNKLIYGITLPILPQKIASELISLFKRMHISNLRVKLNRDVEYTKSVLDLVRGLLGDDFDIRVDANSSWDTKIAEEQLRVLREFKIKRVEDPLSDENKDFPKLFNSGIAEGFEFVSDESMLDYEDFERIQRDGYVSMINIRLSKNGGVFKSLKLGKMADEYGIKYQLGCHVGETGVLSASGRVVASLLKDPLYIDGSYDSYILSDNVTTEDINFGLGGEAKVIRGISLGYTVDLKKLRRLSVEITEYF